MDSALNFLQLIETKSFQLRINKNGYWEFRHIGNDSNSEYNKYKRWKLVHRVVAELKTGPIPRGYQVHHVDHDKTNKEYIESLAQLVKLDTIMQMDEADALSAIYVSD